MCHVGRSPNSLLWWIQCLVLFFCFCWSGFFPVFPFIYFVVIDVHISLTNDILERMWLRNFPINPRIKPSQGVPFHDIEREFIRPFFTLIWRLFICLFVRFCVCLFLFLQSRNETIMTQLWGKSLNFQQSRPLGNLFLRQTLWLG